LWLTAGKQRILFTFPFLVNFLDAPGDRKAPEIKQIVGDMLNSNRYNLNQIGFKFRKL